MLKMVETRSSSNTRYFYKQHFYKQRQAEIDKKQKNKKKKQAKAKQYPEAELLLFENYSFSSSMLSTNNNGRYFKICKKNKNDCLNEVIRLMRLNMRLKMEYRPVLT